MKNLFVTSVLTLLTLFAMSQSTINYNNMSFKMPAGWAGQEVDGGYYMQSQNGMYYLILQPVPFESYEQLQQELNAGIEGDEGSASLYRTGDFERVATSGLGAYYTSNDWFNPITMYVAGLYHTPGRGVLLLAGESQGQYAEAYPTICKQVAQSVSFKKISTPALRGKPSNNFEKNYSNVRLTYFDSYYSSGYGDIGGGYRQKIIIDLCGKGYFTYSDNYEMSGGGSNSSFGSNNNSSGNGTWSIKPRGQYSAVLTLLFYNGEVYTYTLETNDAEETYLDGNRYYRSNQYDDPEYRPECY